MGIEELAALQAVIGLVGMLVRGETPTEEDLKKLLDAEAKMKARLVTAIEADIAAQEAAAAKPTVKA